MPGGRGVKGMTCAEVVFLCLLLLVLIFVLVPWCHLYYTQALDFYLSALLATYQRWLVESPSKMEIRLDSSGNSMKEMIARQVRLRV